MKSLPKPVIIAAIAIIVLTAGSLFLIRSCLFGKNGKDIGGAPAGMREQFASSPALYAEKESKSVIIAIVSHLKIHSYSRKGNMIQKRASTTYYVQANDAVSGAMLGEVKLKAHTDIKNYPVEVLGMAGTTAWFFAGEPMAFDAFSLDKKADINMLEQKNPHLTGKFPAERRYYIFNNNGTIYFTAMDGTKWELNTATLLATAKEFTISDDFFVQQIASVEQAEKQNQADLDSLYRQKDREPSKQYAAGKISYDEYNRISKQYREERDILFKRRDSLRQVKYKWRDLERSGRELQRNLENLRDGNPDYSRIRINQDTLNGIWYGLYSPGELQKLNSRLQYHSENDETARRQLYLSTCTETRPGTFETDKAAMTAAPSQNSFLHGGFLLDKKTALPIHIEGPSFIIVHKDQIGREASILISRLSADGKKEWTFNTGLTGWADWFYNGKQLIIMGTDNKNLSSGQVNVLLCLDISTGKAFRYDYYSNKVVTDK